jgi:hypothetical protein
LIGAGHLSRSHCSQPDLPVPDLDTANTVTDTDIHVWEYRATVADPEGDWQFVETHHRADDPRLSLEYAELSPGTEEGHWVYSRTYDCEIDCN